MDILVTTPGSLHRMLKRGNNCYIIYALGEEWGVGRRGRKKEERQMDILVTTPGSLHTMLKRSNNCYITYALGEVWGGGEGRKKRDRWTYL